MSSLTGLTGDEELQEQITETNDLATLQKQRIDDILATTGAITFGSPSNNPLPNSLGVGVVGSANLEDRAVTNAILATTCVSTPKLQNSAVTTAKLADNAVNLDKIADSSKSISSTNGTLALRDSSTGGCGFGPLTCTTLTVDGLTTLGDTVRFDNSTTYDKQLNVVGYGNPCNSIIRFGQNLNAGGYICYDNQNSTSSGHTLGDWSGNTADEGLAIGLYWGGYYPIISAKLSERTTHTCNMHGNLNVATTISATQGITGSTISDATGNLRSAITTNATAISTNATAISTNATAISTNATAISTNATDINTNATDISTNATAISTNATAITTNATAITTNAANISTNAANISTNATDINTNATAISTNATAITGKQDSITSSSTISLGTLTVAQDLTVTGTIRGGALTSVGTFSNTPSTFGDAQVCFGDSTTGFASLQAGSNYGGIFNKQGYEVLRFNQTHQNIQLFGSLTANSSTIGSSSFDGNTLTFNVSTTDKALNVVGLGNPCNSIIRTGQSITAGGYICYDNQNNTSSGHSLGDWSENTTEGLAIGVYLNSTHYPFISALLNDRTTRTCKMHGPLLVTGNITATSGTTIELGGSTTNVAKLITYSNRSEIHANTNQSYARKLQFNSNGWLYYYNLSAQYTSGDGIAADRFYSASGSSGYTTSDSRVKTDIAAADTMACYNAVKAVPLHTYGYIPSFAEANKRTGRRLGWIAQEVEATIPNSTYTCPKGHPVYEIIQEDLPANSPTFENGNGIREIEQVAMIKQLWGAVQVLMAKVETLEQQIASNQVLKRSFAEISEEQS